MTMTKMRSRYYAMGLASSAGKGRVSLPNPSEDDTWSSGRPFDRPPAEPIEIATAMGHAKAGTPDYLSSDMVMSERLYRALLAAGVDNLEAYDVVFVDRDSKAKHTGFKAVNVIGIVDAAATQEPDAFDDQEEAPPDANTDGLAIDPRAARDLLLFRLAEPADVVVVHEKVVEKLAKYGSLQGVVFRRLNAVRAD
jgi:hypothetical protein